MTVWYQLDTGWACGGIEVVDGKIVGGAPIFRRLVGQRIESLAQSYRTVAIDGEEMSMGRTVPTGVKEPFEQLPGGTLQMETVRLEEAVKGGDNLFCYVATLKVTAPESAAGQEHQETFFIGTEEDPNAETEDTWIKRAGRLKQYVEKSGVAFEGADMDVVMSEIQQTSVLALVRQSHEPEMKKGQPNPYAGRVRSNVKSWLAVGEREPALEEVQLTSLTTGGGTVNGSGGMAAPTRPAAPAAARPAAPAAPTRPTLARPGVAPAPKPRVGGR